MNNFIFICLKILLEKNGILKYFKVAFQKRIIYLLGWNLEGITIQHHNHTIGSESGYEMGKLSFTQYFQTTAQSSFSYHLLS